MRDPLLDLRPFARTASAAETVRAGAARAGSRLRLRFHLQAEARGTWHIPTVSSRPARRDRLWERTCCEAFVAAEGTAAYWEINLAPSGDWNVYRFDGPRRGMRPDERVSRLPLRRRGDGHAAPLALAATIDLMQIPELAAAPLQVALAAVVEQTDGQVSHWALRHDGAQPDFHDRATFLVRLESAAEVRP
jgi:hypothetical protein